MKRVLAFILSILIIPVIYITPVSYAAEELVTYTVPALNAEVKPITVNKEDCTAEWQKKNGDEWESYEGETFTKGEYRIHLDGELTEEDKEKSELQWSKDGDESFYSNSFKVAVQYTFNVKVGNNAAPAGLDFKIKDGKNIQHNVSTNTGGKLVLEIYDETESKRYEYTFNGSNDYFAISGSVENNGTITLTERGTVSSSDYKVKEAKNGYIKNAGNYILIAQNCKLSLTQSGEGSNEITVHINASGEITTDFYVIKNGSASKKATGQVVPVDKTAPVIQNCSVEAADSNTYVKQHGIYGKTKASLVLTATIVETESGVDRVYLKAGDRTYEPTASGSDYSIAIDTAGLQEEKFYLVAVDKLGNESQEVLIRTGNPQGSEVTLETISPQIEAHLVGPTVTSGETLWYTETPTIDVTMTDDSNEGRKSGIASYSIKVDGVEVEQKTINEKIMSTEVQKKFAITSNTSGLHEYTIQAKDNSGNIGTHTITAYIDNETPTIEIQNVEAIHYQNIPTITVYENASYYSQDGCYISVKVLKLNPETGSYEEYRSADQIPKVNQYTIPADWFSEDGTYRIEAFGIDAAQKESTASLEGIVRDKTGPVNSLEISGTKWRTSEPTVTYSATDALSEVQSIALYLDDKLLTTSGNSIKLSNIKDTSDGSHIVKFVSTDSVGNVTETTGTFYFDNVTPALSMNNVEAYRNTNPSIKITDKDNYPKLPGSQIYVKITRDGKAVVNDTHSATDSVEIKPSYFSEDGKYVITVNATDQAGNKAKEISQSFVKDATSPKVTLSGAKNKSFYSKPVTLKCEVIDANLDNVDISIKKELDGKSSAVGWNWKSSKTKTFNETGTYTITVKAKDKAGNTSATQSLSFTVDTKPPEITISGVQEGKIYTKGQSIKPVITIHDSYLKGKNATIVREEGSSKVSSIAGKSGFTFTEFKDDKDYDGKYTINVTATDSAGNATTKKVTFTVNKFGSVYKIVQKPKQAVTRSVSTPVVISAKNPSNIKSYECNIIRDAQTEAAQDVKTDKKGTTTTYTIPSSNFEKDGTYRVNLVTTDEAGNTSESRDTEDFWFTIDTVAPNITYAGIEEGATYQEDSHRFTVSATDSVSKKVSIEVLVNGSRVEFNDGEVLLHSGYDQKITINATDEAGNTATKEVNKVSVSSSNLAKVHAHKGLFIGLGVAMLGIIGLAIFLLIRGRDDDDNDDYESNESIGSDS